MPVRGTTPNELTPRQLDAVVKAASPELLKRALRLVIGSGYAYWERDLDREAMWYSPTFFEMLGLPPDQQDRDQINSHIHPDDKSRFDAAYQNALTSGTKFMFDLRYLNHRRMYRWARTSGRVWRHEDGRPRLMTGVVVDIDVEKRLVLQAEEDRRIAHASMAMSSETRFTASSSLSELRLDSNFARLLGYGSDADEVVDIKRWLHVAHPDDRAGLSEWLHQAMAERGRRMTKTRLRAADGSYRWHDVRSDSFVDSFGMVRVVGIVADCHHRTMLEDEIRLLRQRLIKADGQQT
jgi:PAS domain S-box-containing protein